MAGRPKSEETIKLNELKAQLPKNFNGQEFRGCKVDGKIERSKVAKLAEDKGFTAKLDAIMDYLTYLANKPAAKGKKPKKDDSAAKEEQINLLAKKTYKELSSDDITKLISMLSEIEKSRKETEIEQLKAEKEKLDARLKKLQGK